MKRFIAILTVFACIVPFSAHSAVNVKKSSGVKKAAPVATQKADKMDSVASLLPSVINLVGSVKALRSSQEQLSADCVPTSSEIQFVNDLVKEWAKTGEVSAEDAVKGIGDKPCNNKNNPRENNYDNYKGYLEQADPGKTCYETFSSNSDKEMIWLGFPRASYARVCNELDTKDCKDETNIYEVFAKINFSDEDYTQAEAEKIAQFKAKEQRCAKGRINAAKRELYGNFVTQTLGSLGQNTGVSGTDAILQTVSAMGGSGNVQSMLPSLGTMATQMFDK